MRGVYTLVCMGYVWAVIGVRVERLWYRVLSLGPHAYAFRYACNMVSLGCAVRYLSLDKLDAKGRVPWSR